MKEGDWCITVDHIADPLGPRGSPQNAVGLVGPADSTAEAVDFTAEREGMQFFHMKDDDGVLCYEGLCYLPSGLGDEAFNPLDHFGQPNAGCTEIWYREGDDMVQL